MLYIMGLEKNHLAISTSIYYAWAIQKCQGIIFLNQNIRKFMFCKTVLMQRITVKSFLCLLVKKIWHVMRPFQEQEEAPWGKNMGLLSKSVTPLGEWITTWVGSTWSVTQAVRQENIYICLTCLLCRTSWHVLTSKLVSLCFYYVT